MRWNRWSLRSSVSTPHLTESAECIMVANDAIHLQRSPVEAEMAAYPSHSGWVRRTITAGVNGISSRDGGLKDATAGSDGNAFSPSSGIALYR